MEKERIDKLISSQLNISRKDVTKLIKQKKVYVNDLLIKSSSEKVNPLEDNIIVDKKRLEYKKHIYLMHNKPKGVVSATEDKNEKTVLDLVPDKYKRKDLFLCGRLDKDTTGLLVLTDDGEFLHKLMSPKNRIFKTYIVKLDKKIEDEVKEMFLSGIRLKDGYICKEAYFEKINDDTARISICEGKYHQIKRMCAACSYQVLDLERVKIGSLYLDKSLKKGDFRELTNEELGAMFI